MSLFAGGRSVLSTLGHCVAGAALLCFIGGPSTSAVAQDGVYDPANYAWQAGAIRHAQKMRAFFDSDRGQQATPPVIPKFELDFDPSGLIATTQPGGPTQTSQNAFFANLGTNGRTCFSCHEPQTGWTVSAASVQARFYTSYGNDPIFRLVDGATCPSADVSSIDAKRQAYSLLLHKGLIRIGLQVPTTIPGSTVPIEFRIVSVDDPYGCNINPTTGLTSFGPANPTAGIVSVYRRPLPATNLGFLTAIMWDGREPTLAQQSIDATLGHAQANAAPSTAQQQQIVDFESGIFTAQLYDRKAKYLNAAGATGGPDALAKLLAGFYVGINDPVPSGLPPSFGNPKGLPFTSKIFDLYRAWISAGGSEDEDIAEYRRSVARGEELFNNTPINITGVAGLNDALNATSIPGFCGTCHDTPDVGNHSRRLPINIGIANGGSNDNNPGLDIDDLPVFTLQCTSGPLTGKTYIVTDPGRALISGKCADIGKVKGPILRGLAGRAPYFHNGSAATLLDVVKFYNLRFNMGLTSAQMNDLAAFLQTL
jgi:cytochrome c peroxidase